MATKEKPKVGRNLRLMSQKERREVWRRRKQDHNVKSEKLADHTIAFVDMTQSTGLPSSV